MTDPLIGRPLAEVDTPALLLDRQRAEHNIEKLAEFCRQRPVSIRPHFKNHKCVTLMKKQLAAGQCCGVTVAKLGEAEVLVENGVDRILIANQVIGPAKMQRLTELARRAEVIVAVDSEAGVNQLDQAGRAAGLTLQAVVETDTGMNRCGTAPGSPSVELAKIVDRAAGVRLRGVMGYEGHAVCILDPDEQKAVTGEALRRLCRTAELMRAEQLPIDIVSAGGTGTYPITGNWPGITELQCGSYVTMDWFYRRVRPEFAQAVSVLVTVISRPKPGLAVADAGTKTMGAEFGPPMIKDRPGDRIEALRSEEHALIQLGTDDLRVGQKIELIPSHCCTTCNLHRRFVVHDGGIVSDVWPIEASGKLQ